MTNKLDTQKAPRAFRTISEVAGELALQPYVIRFWESQFKQIKPMRRKGGRRYYRPRDIDFLRGLKALLHGENLTIKKVKETILKNGKGFVVANRSNEINQSSAVEKRKIQFKFSHAGVNTLYIKANASEKEKFQVNLLIESFNELRKKMIARNNI